MWELLTSEPGHPFSLLAGAHEASRDASRLSAVDGLDQLAGVPAGALVLVPLHCVAHVANYELDVAVRVASDRGAAGLVLVGTTRLPVTVKQLADRAGLTIIGAPGTESVVDLVRRLDYLMGRGHAAMLERAIAVVNWVRSIDSSDIYLSVLRDAGARLAAELRLTWLEQPRGPTEPVLVGGRTVGWVHGGDSDDLAVALALPSIATAIGRCYERLIINDEANGEVVANLIDADGASRWRVMADRAPALDVNLDARHVVICITSEPSADAIPADGLLAARHRRTLATIVLRERLGLPSDSWLVTRIEGDIALLWTRKTAEDADNEVAAAAAEQVMTILHREYPGSQFFGGIGSIGTGVDGLRSSAAEAKAASRSARSRGLAGRAVQVYNSRLEQVLSDVVTSSVSRRIIDGVLAPLDALPDRWRHAMIETMSTYLDMQGSKVRAAAALHMHPNAIGYRVRKAVKMLGIDLSDPDARFVLQLACRVWLMSRPQASEAER